MKQKDRDVSSGITVLQGGEDVNRQLEKMNPESEIVSWNGLVSDIMQNENELVEITLYKLKFEWYVKLCKSEGFW